MAAGAQLEEHPAVPGRRRQQVKVLAPAPTLRSSAVL